MHAAARRCALHRLRVAPIAHPVHGGGSRGGECYRRCVGTDQAHGYLELLLLYLAETVIIGILNIPKMFIVALFAKRLETLQDLGEAGKRASLILMVVFPHVIVLRLVAMLLYVAIAFLPTVLAVLEWVRASR